MTSLSRINLRECPDKGIAGQQTCHDTLVISESVLSVTSSKDRGYTHSKKPLPAVAVMAKDSGRPTRKVMSLSILARK